jgi:hypothetical protein
MSALKNWAAFLPFFPNQMIAKSLFPNEYWSYKISLKVSTGRGNIWFGKKQGMWCNFQTSQVYIPKLPLAYLCFIHETAEVIPTKRLCFFLSLQSVQHKST